MLGPVEIEQLAAQFGNSFALARADRLLALTGGDDDAVGHVPGADPLGALEVDGQPGGLGSELAFPGGAGLDVVHPLLDSLVDAFGILGRQGGHQREARSPCLSAFSRDFVLPFSLLGPVLFCALR